MVGELIVEVKYGQQVPKQLSLVIINGKGQCLLGSSWFHHIQLDRKKIAAISYFQDPTRDNNAFLEEYSGVLLDKL